LLSRLYLFIICIQVLLQLRLLLLLLYVFWLLPKHFLKRALLRPGCLLLLLRLLVLPLPLQLVLVLLSVQLLWLVWVTSQRLWQVLFDW
jgi:hypothetical protein